jgi:hypothetical protein
MEKIHLVKPPEGSEKEECEWNPHLGCLFSRRGDGSSKEMRVVGAQNLKGELRAGVVRKRRRFVSLSVAPKCLFLGFSWRILRRDESWVRQIGFKCLIVKN